MLPHVHTFNRHFAGNFGVIIHNQGRAGPRCQFVQIGRKVDKLIDGVSLSPKLDQIYTAFDHCVSYASGIRFFNVTQIHDAVEPALTQILTHESCLDCRSCSEIGVRRARGGTAKIFLMQAPWAAQSVRVCPTTSPAR